MNLSDIPITHRKLGRSKALGRFIGEELCRGEIEIDPRQSDFDYLDTLIHEYLHALLPTAVEEEIIRLSTQLSQALWNQGYTKTNNQ